MAKYLKTQPIKLDPDSYFEDLPTSVLENIADHNLFANFVEHELELEVIRAIKHTVLEELYQNEIDEALEGSVQNKAQEKRLKDLKNHTFPKYIVNFLNLNDQELISEEQIYN